MPKQASEEKTRQWKRSRNDSGGMVYVLGLVGAVIYFIQHANSFGEGVVGVLKAIVWPAFVVYRLLEFLKF